MGAGRAFLDGHPLAGSVSWGLTTGVRAYSTTVMISRANADKLLGGGAGAASGGGVNVNRPVTLTLEPGFGGKLLGAKRKTFSGVYILHRAPGPNPHVAALTIADRRWLWPNTLYRRYLNIRRKVGTQRLISPNQLDPLNLEPRLQYALWSLKGGTAAWTATDLLNDLAKAIQDFENEETKVTPAVSVPRIAADSPEALPIQDLELDGELDGCIERALAALPGMDVYVRASGDVRFFWRSDTSEMDEVRRAGPAVQNRGWIEPIDFSRIRPRKIRVYFDVEAELAFRADEDAGTSGANGPDDLWCENVIPIPDPSLTLAVGGTVSTGSYVGVDRVFAAWGEVPNLGTALTKPIVRQALVPFQSLWNAMKLHGDAAPQADWAARFGAVQTHYRTTFRINPAWLDRIYELRPYRVATINTATGTRGDASVFTDFAYLSTMRSLIAEQLNSGVSGYCINVAGYPANDAIADDTIAAPAKLSVVDSEQGIFSIDYHGDPYRMYEMALPSQVELVGANTAPGVLVSANQAGPSPFLRRHNRPLGFNVLGQFQAPPALTARHKLIAILTAVPASPNSKAALAYVDIDPKDVPAFKGQSSCFGPMLEIRIGGAMETARVAWLDSQRARIKSFFTANPDTPVNPSAAYPLSDLVVNYSDSKGGAASLQAIAKAAAARILHALRDRAAGSATFGFRGDADIQGAIAGVHHELSMSGALTTRYDLPGRVDPLTLERYLDSKALRIVRRIINPGK